MRCLIFNTKEIEFITGEPSNRPLGIESVINKNEKTKFKKVSVVLVCVEAKDNDEDTLIILDEIKRYYMEHKLHILIVPFVHLSSNIEGSPIAHERILFIANKLKNKDIPSDYLSFGFDRAWIAKWVTILHKGNVAFRDSKYKKTNHSKEC